MSVAVMCVAYLCLLNACIGLYVGSFGLDGFARPRPTALPIILLGVCAGPLLLYAQRGFGFRAQPASLVASVAAFAIAFIVARRLDLDRGALPRNTDMTCVDGCGSDVGATEDEDAAGELWQQGRYAEARRLYQSLVSESPQPMDRAKLLTNIAQIYEKEGDKVRAIAAAQEAMQIVSSYEQHRSLEGTQLRGFLNGFLNRLKGRKRWAAPEFDAYLPLEMNLSVPGRLRVHFSIAVIAAALSATIGSQVPIPQLNVVWTNGSITSYSIVGCVFGWAATKHFFERTVLSLCVSTGRPAYACLKPAANTLTVVALFYLILLPLTLYDLVSAVAWFGVSACVGVAIFPTLILGWRRGRVE